MPRIYSGYMLYIMLSVEGWTAEVMKLKERLVQLEKEKGMTEKICEDQENELKVCMHTICTCLVFKVFATCFGIIYMTLYFTVTEKLTRRIASELIKVIYRSMF